METHQKKFFGIVGGVIAVVVTVVSMGSNDAPEGLMIPPDTKAATGYDQKLKQARQSSQENEFVNSRASYYEGDSIYVNGAVVENPVIVQRKTEEKQQKERIDNINGQMARALGGLQSALSDNDNYDYDESEATPTPKSRNLSVKQYQRMQAQQQAIPQKTTPQAEPQYSETDKERRKRMFDEGYSGSAPMVCVIHRTQEVRTGAMVALRVIDDCNIGDLYVPKNAIVYADLKVNSNRALLSVGSIRVNGAMYSVALIGRGDDGLDGLPLSGSTMQKQLNTDVADAVVSEATNFIASAAGSIGRSVGNIARGAVRGKSREQDTQIRLIDKQRVTFYIEEQ